jgi:LacI family transcriptional regulator
VAVKADRPGSGIRDVARLAGVSISTVSRVLNGRSSSIGTGSITEERVRGAALQLNYRPNAWARSLRTASTRAVGVIVFDLSHPFATELLQEIYTACRAREYHVLMGTAEHDRREGWVLSDILSAGRVDGVILIGDTLLQLPGTEDRFRKAMARLVRTHRHVVTVGNRPSAAGEWSIMIDNAAGVNLAMEHLVRLGHRRIAFVGDGFEPDSWENEQRRQAYRRFLLSHDLPQDPALEIVVRSMDTQATQAALGPLLLHAEPPTAAFFINCATAIAVLKALLLLGIRVPEDMSLLAFDDVLFSALTTPGLTTIRQPIDEMGTYAAGLLLDAMDGQSSASPVSPTNRTIVFTPTLVHRESCAPPPAVPPRVSA